MKPELKDEDLLNRFEKEVNVVKTKADELVRLVKQRGEISFDDAAKALGADPSTIESWANFLEEENVLSIKYNFTTPFITVFTEKPETNKTKQKPSKIIKEKSEKKEESKDDDPNEVEFSEKNDASDIETLLAEAYGCIKKKKFEKAKEIYSKIEARYNKLPEEFLKKKDSINQNLVKLSDDLGMNLSKESRRKMEKNSQEIHKLLGDIQSEIRKGNIVSAIRIYGDIKERYNELPNGFLEQKLVLQNSIIDAYEELITVREKKDLMDISEKKTEIITMLEEMNQAIKEKNIQLAIKLYTRIREMYNTLPSGFLQEKAELQSRILRLYDQLLSDYKRITMEDMEKKTERIEELSRDMNKHLEKKEIEPAREIYSKMKEVFYSMPEGFLRQKTELQRIMLNLYERLAIELDKTSVYDFNKKYNIIENMLKESFSHVKNKRYDLAHELYNKIINTYNSLPSGFLQKKTELRTRILSFYKDISNMDSTGKIGINMPELKESLRDDSKEMILPNSSEIDYGLKNQRPIPKMKTGEPLQKPQPKILKNPEMKIPPMPPRQKHEKNPLPMPKDIKSTKKQKKPFYRIFKKDEGAEIEPPKPP